MGNVQSLQGTPFESLGEKMALWGNEVTKLFTCVATAPKTPVVMPNLGDGRSQDELRTTAEIMYNMDTKQNVNIAFIGVNNESKTAFINSLRFVADARPDTGIVSPKNAAVQYIHCDPSYKHLRFWDIGDVGGSYIDRCLYAFDCVVLVTTEVLRDSDIDMIKQGCQVQPPVGILIVRTGMDAFITKEYGFDPSVKDITEGKKNQGQIIREMFQQQLQRGGVMCPNQAKAIYLVSSQGMLAARAVNFDGTKYIWDEYDFMKGILDCIGKRRY